MSCGDYIGTSCRQTWERKDADSEACPSANLAKKGVALDELPQDLTGFDDVDGKPVYGKYEGDDADVARPMMHDQAEMGRTTSSFQR